MKSRFVVFSPNEPLELALDHATDAYRLPGKAGCLYSLSDGRLLHLTAPVADSLALLKLEPGDSFRICLHDQKTGEVPFWSVWLSPDTEKRRAAEETTDLERDLQRSLELVGRGQRPVLAATGTDGPVPLPAKKPAIAAALASGKRKVGEPIPLNVAFREIVHFVVAELNASGEQWSENSRQDLVSTLLISAQKANLLCVWERGAA